MDSIFDEYADRYDQWYEKNRSAYLSEIEAVKKVLPKKGRGLEIGVGTGRFAAPLGIGEGIDPSPAMLEKAAERGIKPYLGKGEKLPFPDFCFDYAVIIITFCFVRDQSRVLKEAYRVLKDNGKIILGIIDKNSFLGQYYQKKKSVFYRNARFFSVKEASDLLLKAGFGGLIYYQTLFKLPRDLKAKEKPVKGFGKGGFVVIRGKKCF